MLVTTGFGARHIKGCDPVFVFLQLRWLRFCDLAPVETEGCQGRPEAARRGSLDSPVSCARTMDEESLRGSWSPPAGVEAARELWRGTPWAVLTTRRGGMDRLTAIL